MTPQIIYLLLVLAGMLMAAHQHGKPKEGKHNFWISLLAWLITASCLYYGGFFNVFFK